MTRRKRKDWAVSPQFWVWLAAILITIILYQIPVFGHP
jgi:hypothetical protein